MKGMCKKCKKRDTCKTLCKKAEDYVNQDYIERDESLLHINVENREEEIEYDDIFDEDMQSRIINNRYKTAVINLFLDGKNTKEIAYHVPYSLRQIQRIIKDFKEKRHN